MALKANFEANFNKLYTALDEAEVRFKSTALEGTKLQSAIDKIGDKWSGRKVIEDAALMAASIEKIGGASVLTAAEARRVNATLNEALEKANKTGIEASAAMKKLAADTAGAAQSGGVYQTVINGISNAAKAAAASFVAMFAFTKIIEMGKALLDFGERMQDLSGKTGLSTDALQKFEYAGGQVGVSLETITGASLKLQRAIAGDSKSAAEAFKTLGFSVDDLRKMSPEEAMLAIAGATTKLGDETSKTTVLSDLFGRQFGEMVPIMSQNFVDLTQRAEDLNLVIDKQANQAMADLKDKASELGSVAFAALAKIIAPLVPLLEAIATVSLQVASVLGDRLADTINIVGAAAKWMANRFIDMTLSVVETAKTISEYVPGLEKATGATSLLGQAADRLRGMQASLNAEQTTAATTSKAVAVAAEEAEQSTKKQADAVAALVKELSGAGAIEKVKTLEAAFRQLTPEQQGNERVIRDVLGQYEKYRDIVGTKLSPALEELFVKHGTLKSSTLDAKTAFIELVPAIESAIGKYGELGLIASESRTDIDASRMSVEEWAKKTGAVLAPALTSANVSLEVSKEKTTDWSGSLDNLVRSFEQLANIGGESFKGLVQWFGQVVASSKLARDGGEGFAKALDGVKAGGKQAVASMVNLAASAMSIIGAMDQATASGNTLQRTIGGVNAGFQAGNAIFPGVGGAIGAVAGGLVGLVRGLSSVSEETKKVRTEIAAFEDNLRKNLTTTQAAEAAGRNWAATTIAVRDAYAMTGRSAAEAEAIVKQLWDDKNPAAARAAIEQINAVMAEAKRIAEELDAELNGALGEAVNLGIRLPEELSASIQSLIDMGKITGDNAALFATLTGDSQNQFKAMEEAAKKYGVELSALGPAFAQNKLDERARDIIDAFGAMTRGGGDVTGVIAGMSDEINAFVQDAIRSGRTVPENMRPIIEAMIEQGQLTDENGEKLTDMSGINFGPPIESAFDRIIAKLEELINRIADPSGYNQMAHNAQSAGNAVADIFDRTIVPAVERASDAVDALNFGHSPGGLKEIPILSLAAGKAVDEFSKSAGKSFSDTYQSLDDLLGQIRDISIDFERVQPKNEKGEENEFAGFVIPSVGLISEAKALERIKRVAEFYGRAISDGEAARILQAYGYKGGGNVIKGRLDKFLQELSRRFIEEQYVGFASGTKQMGSWFRNFGSGMKAVLHGEEAVVPRGQARQFAEDITGGDSGGTVEELRALRSDMLALPQHLARAVRDAILVAG